MRCVAILKMYSKSNFQIKLATLGRQTTLHTNTHAPNQTKRRVERSGITNLGVWWIDCLYSVFWSDDTPTHSDLVQTCLVSYSLVVWVGNVYASLKTPELSTQRILIGSVTLSVLLIQDVIIKVHLRIHQQLSRLRLSPNLLFFARHNTNPLLSRQTCVSSAFPQSKNAIRLRFQRRTFWYPGDSQKERISTTNVHLSLRQLSNAGGVHKRYIQDKSRSRSV